MNSAIPGEAVFRLLLLDELLRGWITSAARTREEHVAAALLELRAAISTAIRKIKETAR